MMEAGQLALFEFAKSDEHVRKRIEAVKGLTDQGLLAGLVKSDTNFYVRACALLSLKDQGFFKEIIGNPEYGKLRFVAAGLIDDHELLAELITDADSQVRIEAAGNAHLADQDLLKYTAGHDRDPEVRRKAMERVTDQAFLADALESEQDHGVRIAAAGNLTDQAYLSAALKSEEDFLTRVAMVKNLTDQQALADIAKNGTDDYIQKCAIGKLDCRQTLTRIESNDDDYVLRFHAAAKLAGRDWDEAYEEEKWAGIAVSQSRDRFGWASCPELVYREITGERYNVKYVLDRIHDPYLLAYVSARTIHSAIYEKALDRIRDRPELVGYVALKAKSAQARVHASRFADRAVALEVLAGIAKDENTSEYCRTDAINALERFKNMEEIQTVREVLVGIAKNRNIHAHGRINAVNELMRRFKRDEIQAELAEIAETANTLRIRLMAEKGIDDKKISKSIMSKLIRDFRGEPEAQKICIDIYGGHDYAGTCTCARCGAVDNERHKWEFSHRFWYGGDGFTADYGWCDLYYCVYCNTKDERWI